MTPEQKSDYYRKSARFWQGMLLAVMAVPTVLNWAGRKQNEALAENTTFGETTTVAGNYLRWRFLAKCGDNCKTVDQLLQAGDTRPEEKFVGDVLRSISKDPVGKGLIEQVAARGVVFDGREEYFKQTSVCAAAGTYNLRYGVINYSVGDMEAKDAINKLADIFNHELFHANQRSEGKRFPGNVKDQMIYTLAIEAAAYAFDDVMEARRNKMSKPDAKPISDEETLKSLKDYMKRVLTHNKFRSVRQYYIISQNPRLSDYDEAPRGVTLQMLQDAARLPDGRSFFPDDMTVEKMDIAVRGDFYDEMKQRKPAELPIAPTGEVGTSEGPSSEKSQMQRHREDACKSRGVRPAA